MNSLANILKSSACVAAVTASWLCTGTALAQSTSNVAQMQMAAAAGEGASSPGEVTETIIVTAEKRATTVQETPVSIAALSGQDLQDRGVSSLAGLAQGTPGVSLKTEGPSQTEIEMRGMTSSGGNSATVGFYLDDVPLTGPASAQNGHVIIDPDLYDLNRIEVLRGPQGTLFGSGSMGGTVRLITNLPNTDAFSMTAENSVSATDGGDGVNHKNNVMFNVPLSDTLALRIVGSEDFTSGWIDRIVIANGDWPSIQPPYTQRVDVQNLPVASQYPGSNAYQIYGTRISLLWNPIESLTITPSFFWETSVQNGISAYDSVSGGVTPASFGMAHYQPFDVPEPLTDTIRVFSLTANYSFPDFDVTSSTGRWTRLSTQVQDASEAFNSPVTGVTNYANGVTTNPDGSPACSGESFYGPCGSGIERGKEIDPSEQWSEELRFASKSGGKLDWVAGLYWSDFYSRWTFNGQTPNFASFMDFGTLEPATTSNWFVANSPTSLMQYAAFGDATYSVTDALKVDAGIRLNRFVYRFSSCINGWGSSMGAATPSCTGLIPLDSNSFTPKINISYTFSPDLMVYANAAEGFRPGGGNAYYPTTGPVWGPAYTLMNYSTACEPNCRFPDTYKPDSVWSYEVGEKSRLFDRLTLNSSVYFEDWRKIQLEAYPNDWALNINGNYAQVYGGDIDLFAELGWGFDLSLAFGYLHEALSGGPHWDIPPVHRLPDVAPENGNLLLRYTTPINDAYTFTAQIENSYTGVRYSLDFPVLSSYNCEASGCYAPMPAYDLTNVRFGVRSRDNWSVNLFVDNVFNKHAALESMFTLNEPTTPYTRVETNQPLTGGVDVTYTF